MAKKTVPHTTSDTDNSKPMQTHPDYSKKDGGDARANKGLKTAEVGSKNSPREVHVVDKPSRVFTRFPAYFGREVGGERLYPAGSVIPDFVGPLGKGMRLVEAKGQEPDTDED